MNSKNDGDMSKKALDYYKIIYKDIDSMNFKDDNSEIKATNKESEIKCSGDCCFNFNDKKIEKFNMLIGDDSLKHDLEYASKMHHSIFNFALMPKTGGMNNSKGNTLHIDEVIRVYNSGGNSLDRFDSFLTLLNNFYVNKDKNFSLFDAGKFYADSVFTYSFNNLNFEFLYEFLDSFDNIYEYINFFYPCLNGKMNFVDELIENGKVEMKTKKNLERYLKLARVFWQYATKYYHDKKTGSE